jgi:hypothetical protein
MTSVCWVCNIYTLAEGMLPSRSLSNSPAGDKKRGYGILHTVYLYTDLNAAEPGERLGRGEARLPVAGAGCRIWLASPRLRFGLDGSPLLVKPTVKLFLFLSVSSGSGCL